MSPESDLLQLVFFHRRAMYVNNFTFFNFFLKTTRPIVTIFCLKHF